MNSNDEIGLTEYWSRETTSLNERVDEAFKEAQNHAYDLGFRRGVANKAAWIAVADKLPTLDTYVLLWNGYWRGVGQAVSQCDDETERWQDETTEYIVPKPTHWMPLPDPPAAEAVLSRSGVALP